MPQVSKNVQLIESAYISNQENETNEKKMWCIKGLSQLFTEAHRDFPQKLATLRNFCSVTVFNI